MTFCDLNSLGKERKPFLFITDFKAQTLKVILPQDLKKEDVEFQIDENYSYVKHKNYLKSTPVSFKNYQKKFNKIINKIKSGETYVLNLTQATKIETQLSLKEIYSLSNSHYKLRFKDKFVCFSPEKFIQIDEDRIHAYPMKGTIDASINDAKEKILPDAKEMAEHVMIVDLLRNDLSIVSTNVKVEEFRYVTEVQAGEKNLLQVSSHISGFVGDEWHEKMGTILEEDFFPQLEPPSRI